jgi:hypothetical protein
MKRDNAKKGIGRRGFLRGGSALLGGIAATPFQALLSRHASGAPTISRPPGSRSRSPDPGRTADFDFGSEGRSRT